MRALIVDSSIQIIERLEEIISEEENIIVIHKAVSYEEAKNLFEENKYDVVLLDIDLLGNESLKLLKEIKKNNEEACVIILFTYVDNYIMEQSKALGVNFFVDKYYDFEKISETIDSILQDRRNFQSTAFPISLKNMNERASLI